VNARLQSARRAFAVWAPSPSHVAVLTLLVVAAATDSWSLAATAAVLFAYGQSYELRHVNTRLNSIVRTAAGWAPTPCRVAAVVLLAIAVKDGSWALYATGVSLILYGLAYDLSSPDTTGDDPR